MSRVRVIAPLRPDKYSRIAAAMARENMGVTSGFATAAQRCPDRPGLVDELGTLTGEKSTGVRIFSPPHARFAGRAAPA